MALWHTVKTDLENEIKMMQFYCEKKQNEIAFHNNEHFGSLSGSGILALQEKAIIVNVQAL